MVLAALAFAAAPAGAQQGPAARWSVRRPSLIPDAGGQWGVGLGLGMAYARDPSPGPSAVSAAVFASAKYGITTGSAEATLGFEAPAWLRGWRILAMVRGERLQRTPFFGLANEHRRDDSLQSAHGNLYYRYSLLRATGLGVVHRRIAGPLWLLAAAQIRHYRAGPLEQLPSLFDSATSIGAIPDTLRREGREVRAGLVFDTRDDWHATTRGVMLEAIGATGRLTAPPGESGVSYRRYLFGAREFLPIGGGGRTVLALRQRVSLTRDSLPFMLAYEQLTSWMPSDGNVGSRTMRLHGGGTQLSSNHAMATVEVRRKLILPSDNPAREAGLWGYAFADAALLWEPRESASAGRHEWTLGAGFRLQFSKGSISGVDIGWSDAGPNVTVLNNFAF